jgi:5-(carboxyamino)imidazole ribonucleotide synthase
MIAASATQLGYKTHIYCPDKQSPAFQVTDSYTIADYADQKSLAMFAGKVDVVTYEFENIPKETIDYLSQWVLVRPNAEVLKISQNRLEEKRFVNRLGIETTKFEAVESEEQLRAAMKVIGYPAVLKSNTMGYDGKGQIMIQHGDDLSNVWRVMSATMKATTAILEAYVDFAMEASVIVCRGTDGKKATFPLVENRHEHHILKETIVPAAVSDLIKSTSQEIALKIADGIDLVGVLAVEMFITKDGRVLVNELAPRPHNSGHWSIEGCTTSQFEQLVRCITGNPLGSTKLIAKQVIMRNLIGDEIHSWKSYIEKEGAHLHIYGKNEARQGRKMGHVTFMTEM